MSKARAVPIVMCSTLAFQKLAEMVWIESESWLKQRKQGLFKTLLEHAINIGTKKEGKNLKHTHEQQ